MSRTIRFALVNAGFDGAARLPDHGSPRGTLEERFRAFLGERSIPSHWPAAIREATFNAAAIRQTADRLFEKYGLRPCPSEG